MFLLKAIPFLIVPFFMFSTSEAQQSKDIKTESIEYKDEIERDFQLRSIGQLQVTNLRGGVELRGWALDKIRVRAFRKVRAESKEEAQQLLNALDFRYLDHGGKIELSAEYGRGLDIHERLRERKNPRSGMEMIIFAPKRMNLEVWTADGAVNVQDWGSNLNVRTSSGKISINHVKADTALLTCQSCEIHVAEIEATLRCMSNSGAIHAQDIQGKQIYVESAEGNQTLQRIQGDQLYVTKEGSIQGAELTGRIEFHAQSGNVQIERSKGFVSGSTESGNMNIRMREWKFMDKAIFESVQGNIHLALPARFSGEVDLWSVNNIAQLDFPWMPLTNPHVYGPNPKNHLRGQVAKGGEQLKAFSREGRIQVSIWNEF